MWIHMPIAIVVTSGSVITIIITIAAVAVAVILMIVQIRDPALS